MKDQLVDRYLQGNSCRDGLYLVAWFLCDSWDKKGDYRYDAVPKQSLEAVRVKLDAQASALSSQSLNVKALVLDARIKKQRPTKGLEPSLVSDADQATAPVGGSRTPARRTRRRKTL